MLTNCDIAILNKANELAARYGFKPYDIVATIQRNSDQSTTILVYENPDSWDAGKEVLFERMLVILGIGKHGILEGTPRDIFDALDAALARAPTLHPR